jgi:RES domain-containing protein
MTTSSQAALVDDDETDSKCVCFACVNENYLSDLIQASGKEQTCSYCNETQETIGIEELADHFESAFDRHYRRTSTEPNDFEFMMLRDREGSYDWERHGDPIKWALVNAADVSETIAEDVQKILEERHGDFDADAMGEETPFASDSYYEEVKADDIALRQEWRNFENSLKTESRFFNKGAEAVLFALFEGLTDHETFAGERVVVDAGPRTKIKSLFRARAFQSETLLIEAMKRPDRDLGPAPTHLAASGRMNALGISVFYGALTPEVALAEIRPPVGSRVMIGKFDVVRRVKLLDVEAMRSVLVRGSIFDPDHSRRLERARFLGRLSERITRPVMPNDEPSDYLITQAIADYLSSHAELDGILYPSAQVAGGRRNKNVVLFHASLRVEPLEFPPNTELSAHIYAVTEEGPETDYWVSEEVPAPDSPEQPPPEDPGFLALPEDEINPELRSFTLRIDPESVQVRHIEAVSFKTAKYAVRRHRYSPRDFEF